jgi:hypothetical protein
MAMQYRKPAGTEEPFTLKAGEKHELHTQFSSRWDGREDRFPRMLLNRNLPEYM